MEEFELQIYIPIAIMNLSMYKRSEKAVNRSKNTDERDYCPRYVYGQKASLFSPGAFPS
jgi:hypothetical protein